jgi:hypothetical protein
MRPSQPLQRRIAALAALLALGAATFLPIVGLKHVADGDVDRLALDALLHHASTQFEGVVDSPDEHCIACHLQRAVSGASANDVRQFAPPPASTPAVAPPPSFGTRIDRRGLPPRAPPVASQPILRLRPSSVSQLS